MVLEAGRARRRPAVRQTGSVKSVRRVPADEMAGGLETAGARAEHAAFTGEPDLRGTRLNDSVERELELVTLEASTMHPKILKRRLEVAQHHTKTVDTLISETLSKLLSTFDQYSDVLNNSDGVINSIKVIIDQMNQTDADSADGRLIRSQICSFLGASSQDLLLIALKLSSMADEVRNEKN